jgi:alpha-tubulin suppressor-like RCC1 family protein
MLAVRAACRISPRLQYPLPLSRRFLANTSSKQFKHRSWAYWTLAFGGGTVAYLGLQAARVNDWLIPLEAEASSFNFGSPNLEEDVLNQRPRKRKRTDSEKSNWDSPGVYVWGLNTGKVVAPDSEERWIKSPRRIPFFDGTLIKDLKLDSNFGAAISEKGDLIQWGIGFAADTKTPELTLQGKNLRSLAISDDRIIALGENGTVYSVPVSRERQQSEPKLTLSSLFWSNSTTNIACRDLTPRNLGIGEKVVSITSGLEHILMLTSSGRVFSAAASTKDYPKRGQLGIPGLSWYTRPPGPFDQPYEIKALGKLRIKKIAAGDVHSLVLDNHGRVFSFGDNSHGQLGFNMNPDVMNLDIPLGITPHVVDTPTEVPIYSLYKGRSQPRVTNIAAGGENSFFVVDIQSDQFQPSNELLKSYNGDVLSDVWACGRGIWGALGNGTWTHVQWGPAKVPLLSGLFEYNEGTGKQQPMRVGDFKVGQSHVAAIMANITSVTGRSGRGKHDSNWGSDVFFFGKNDNFQLGTGKRTNACVPTQIQPIGTRANGDLPGTETDPFQLEPPKNITFAGRSVWVEQRLECGRQCTAIYSSAV